jgi:transaldolase
MKFFVDTADTNDIRELAETGLLDGVTTNPSLIHKSGKDFLEVVKEIAQIVPGPVSAEVVATDHAEMMREAEILRKIADNIAVKVPLTIDGLKTCKKLTEDGTMVNVTLPARPSSPPSSAATTISASTACRSSPTSA